MFLVDLAQTRQPQCGGDIADFKCSTTTAGGSLRWDINSVQEFSIDSTRTIGYNLTDNGNTYVFTKASTVTGVSVYTSTAQLNTSTLALTNTVRCSDGGIPESQSLVLNNREYVLYNFLLILLFPIISCLSQYCEVHWHITK